MATFVLDSISGTNWQNLTTRSGEVGSSWQNNPALAGAWYIFQNKVHCGVSGAAFASGVPSVADYDVECDYTVYTRDVGATGIAARMSTTVATMYYCYYLDTELVLAKMINGTITSLGADVSGLMTNGNTYRLRLSCIGPTIRVFVNGVQRISVTDTSITAAGRAGVRASGASDAGTGKHIDNFWAYDTTSPVIKRARFSGIIGA